MLASRAVALLATGSLLAASCGRRAVLDPAPAVRAYADAAARGDARAIYEMLSERSRRDLRPEDVDRMVADERAELEAQAKALRGAYSSLRAGAAVLYPDGQTATLDLENGQFRVSSADGLPPLARTPEQALAELRKALARRSYAALLRVLSPSTGNAIDADLRSLVLGLAHPEALDVQVSGDSAQVRTSSGHVVRLRRESGVWRVEDFD
jgi:hypothetical protein